MGIRERRAAVSSVGCRVKQQLVVAVRRLEHSVPGVFAAVEGRQAPGSCFDLTVS